MTCEQCAGRRCCISAAGCIPMLGSMGREELKHACRARSAAAMSMHVVDSFAELAGWDLLYVERGAAQDEGKVRKKVS